MLASGGKILKHCPCCGQAMGVITSKLTPCLSYYHWWYLHMNILLAPFVCAYCNSTIIALELLANYTVSPTDSLWRSTSALTTWPPVLVKVRHWNQVDTLTTGIRLYQGPDLNWWTCLLLASKWWVVRYYLMPECSLNLEDKIKVFSLWTEMNLNIYNFGNKENFEMGCLIPQDNEH